VQAVLQQTPLAQKPVEQAAGVVQPPPCGMPVLVGVAITVPVAVCAAVAVEVAVAVGVWVTVPVKVAVPVCVAGGAQTDPGTLGSQQ